MFDENVIAHLSGLNLVLDVRKIVDCSGTFATWNANVQVASYSL